MHLKVRNLKREEIRHFSLCLGKALLSLSTNTEKSESFAKITKVRGRIIKLGDKLEDIDYL